MRGSLLCAVAAAAMFGLMPAWATMQCTLTAVPLQINTEGLAEPIGEVLLRCSGGPVNGVLSGTLQISLGRRIANVPDPDIPGNQGGISLSQEVAGGYTPLPVTVRLVNNSVVFEGLNVLMSPQGAFGVKISGIRAEASGVTQAALQFYGNEQLLVGTPVVTVARAQTGMYASIAGAVVSGRGPAAPEYLDFSNMIASGAGKAMVRVTEGHAASFVPWVSDPYVLNGTRILITLTGVPEGARIIAPDAIAGSNAVQPTTTTMTGAGDFGGVYNSAGERSLLLSRVRGGLPDGSKGNQAFAAGSGPMALFGVGDITVDKGTAYAVYEVSDANPSVIESAQIPLWILLPTDRHIQPARIQSTVRLAPLSEVPGSIAGAAIPRYRPVTVGGDCEILGDCAAAYWPHLNATPTRETAYTLPSGGPAQTGYVLLHNIGGGVLEWSALIRYRGTTGWLNSFVETGTADATWRFDVNPKNMATGHYEADLVFKIVNSPTGRVEEKIVPVSLDVTKALPPPAPVPAIRDIVSPATGWGGPAAAGAVVVIQGANFSGDSIVTIGGKTAKVATATAEELTVELPLDVPIGRTIVTVANGDRVSPVFSFETAAIAPGMVYALSENGERNSSENPVTVGKTMDIIITGTRLALAPLTVKLHDRLYEVTPEASAQPGLDVVRITVPEEFPTMRTAVVVCGTTAGGQAACSYPRDVWVKAIND